MLFLTNKFLVGDLNLRLFLFITFLISSPIFAATIEEKITSNRNELSYTFNAGNCIFSDGRSFECTSKEAKKRIGYMKNIAVTEVLSNIRNECTWFDIFSIEKIESSENKKDILDNDGFFLGNTATKFVKIKAKFLCERPLM